MERHPATAPAATAPDEPGTGAGPPKTCPSRACAEGALLLGVMTSGGRLAYLNPPAEVDAGFAAREAAEGHPERRYRFAGPCLEDGCPQWTGRGCAIADMVAGRVNLGLPASPRTLPACGIRHSCRWFSQRGPAACAACPLIVADMGGTDTYQGVKAEARERERQARP
jgi:hypothetical protein